MQTYHKNMTTSVPVLNLPEPKPNDSGPLSLKDSLLLFGQLPVPDKLMANPTCCEYSDSLDAVEMSLVQGS